MRMCRELLLLPQVQTGEGKERAGLCPEASAGSGLTDRSAGEGRSAPPSVLRQTRLLPSPSFPHHSWGPLSSSPGSAAGGEVKGRSGELRPSSLAARPKAFALRAPAANLHACAPTHMCTRTHVRPSSLRDSVLSWPSRLPTTSEVKLCHVNTTSTSGVQERSTGGTDTWRFAIGLSRTT